MIALIALVPALIVFLVGIGTGSKSKTATAALIAAVVGVMTGNPLYMLLDVAATAAAYALAMSMMSGGKSNPSPAAKRFPVVVQPPAQPAPPPIPVTQNGSSDSWVIGLGIVGVAVFLILKFNSPSQPLATPQNKPVPAVYSQPRDAAQPVTSPLPPKNGQNGHKKSIPKKNDQTLESCLKLISNDAMVRCLEKLK